MVDLQREPYDEDFLVDIDSDVDPGIFNVRNVRLTKPALPAWLTCSDRLQQGIPRGTSGSAGGVATSLSSPVAAPLCPRSRAFESTTQGQNAAPEPSASRFSTPGPQPTVSLLSGGSQAGPAVVPSHMAHSPSAVDSVHAADCAIHGRAASSPSGSRQVVDLDAIHTLAADAAGPAPIPALAERLLADQAAPSTPAPLTARAATFPIPTEGSAPQQGDRPPLLRPAGPTATELAADGNAKGICHGICDWQH